MAVWPRFFVPISIASFICDTKIFPSPAEPVLTVSTIVLMTLSTSESSTIITIAALTENSDVYLPVPLPVSTTGFSPFPLPFASRMVHPPTPAFADINNDLRNSTRP